MTIEIDNYDEVIASLNGDVNTTIVTTDGRLPALLCKKIKNGFVTITEDMFFNDKKMVEATPVSLAVGATINRRELIDTIAKFGYIKTQAPESQGDFSSRGDVIDIWADGNHITRIIMFGDQIEAIKTVAPRSFSRLNDLVTFIIHPILPPTPMICLERVKGVIAKSQVGTLVFEHPDEFAPDISYAMLTGKLDFKNFTCIGFQLTDKSHNIFDVAKTVIIRSDFELPAIGDFVVHATHGLGRFIGFKKMRITKDSPERNYLVIEYAKKALVYLPPDKTSLLSNYHGYTKRVNHIGH